ncbi:unnamed protein product [Caenorhabditis angaria]|uniref:Uncharacterized protein n=2 Tax=Rhabditomorpha TaxID=2301119 RepID=A0A9P1IEP2_9PELO|nr:unnamed protein product [Caenorhabditis angaria]
MNCYILFFTSIIFRIAIVSAESESERFNAILSDPKETKRFFGDVGKYSFITWYNNKTLSLDDGGIALRMFFVFIYYYENVKWQDINLTFSRITLDPNRVRTPMKLEGFNKSPRSFYNYTLVMHRSEMNFSFYNREFTNLVFITETIDMFDELTCEYYYEQNYFPYERRKCDVKITVPNTMKMTSHPNFLYVLNLTDISKRLRVLGNVEAKTAAPSRLIRPLVSGNQMIDQIYNTHFSPEQSNRRRFSFFRGSPWVFVLLFKSIHNIFPLFILPTMICMAFSVISFMISSSILSLYLLLATIFVQIMHYLQMLTYIPAKQFLPFNIKLYVFVMSITNILMISQWILLIISKSIHYIPNTHNYLINLDDIAEKWKIKRDHNMLVLVDDSGILEEPDEPLARGNFVNKYRSNHQNPQRPDSHDPNYAENSNSHADSSIFSQGETRDFLQFLRRIQYDHRQVPENERGEATFVDVSVLVSNIRAVSEVTMDYALELFYRESWRDPRLQYDRKFFKNKTVLALHESYTNFLWFPDTFVPNAIASKNPQRNSISHRSLLRLEENGKMLYSRRISLVCECTMDLTLFPFDKQLCKLGIESYGYTADHVVYRWSTGTRKALELSKIRLPDFTIQEAYVTSQMESYATGNYSRLYVCFVFSRSSGFCFLQLIIPSTAVVITSWVSLWMETETEFQDMISIILAITFLIFSYNEMMPRVSYIKAMDIYLGVCFMIVFLSLIKLALVKYMRQKIMLTTESGHSLVRLGTTRHQRRKSSSLTYRNAHAIPTPNVEESQLMLNGNAEPNNNMSKKKKNSTGGFWEIRVTQATMHRFHWVSQMMFFFGFVIFCLFYFLIYPNLHIVSVDPACDKSLAEWFAEIS